MVVVECRIMGDAKRAVGNLARVEGSICAFYMHHETTHFCSHYFQRVGLLSNINLRNDPRTKDDGVQPTLSVLNKSGRPSGMSKKDWIQDKDFRSAHVHVLINCDEVKPILE